jgi:hypothetical protein
MKDLFTVYRKPTEEEFAEMWRLCVFAFDANMLLNIYRYTPETQEKFFAILERLKERIWIPYQAASEYFKRREDVIHSQLKVYDEVTTKLDADLEKLAKELEERYRRHPSIRIESVVEQIKTALAQTKNSLERDKAKHPDFSDSDPLCEKVVELFDGKTGEGFSDAELAKIYVEAEERFKILRPPGFSDAKNKGVPEKYGDVVIWFELIEHAKTEKKPLVFVTDDRKEDWWVKKSGKIISARLELLEEFQKKTNASIYIYQSEKFIEYAFKFFDIEDAQAAVEEVQEVRRQDEAQEAKRNTSFERVDSPKAVYRAVPPGNLSAIEEAVAARVASLVPRSNIDTITHDLARHAASHLKNDVFQNAAREAANLVASRPGVNDLLQSVVANTASQIDKTFRNAISNPTSALNKSVLDVVSAINQPALEATRRWLETLDRTGMRGQHVHRSINIAVSPPDTPDPENAEAVKVEVLLYDAADDEADDEASEDAEDSESTSEDGPYEFGNYPFVVTLVHQRDSPNSYETAHRLRKPGLGEWRTWGAEIEYTRRYWSPEEVAEHNANKSDDEEDATEIFNEFYGEWEANENFYNNIISGIAGVRLDEEDDFPTDQFRQLPPETIAKLRFGVKNAVIKGFYESYCWLGKSDGLRENENLVRQRLSRDSKSYTVDHILRKATDEESLSFRTQVIKAYRSLDEDGKEIIVLKLNLQAADELYDKLIVKVGNATAEGRAFAAETRGDFLREINPVHKLRVLEPHLNINAWYFDIDDIVFP